MLAAVQVSRGTWQLPSAAHCPACHLQWMQPWATAASCNRHAQDKLDIEYQENTFKAITAQ